MYSHVLATVLRAKPKEVHNTYRLNGTKLEEVDDTQGWNNTILPKQPWHTRILF